MKHVYTLIILFAASIGAKCFQNDLGIQYSNYSNNQITNQTTIQTQFKITNYGPNVLLAGDTLYLAASLNGQVYDLSLTKPNGNTPYILKKNLGIDSSLTIAPGNLNGPSTVAYLKTDTVQVSLLLYGVGKTSIGSTFPADANPKNNITSVTYDPTGEDLGINYLDYSNGQVLTFGNIQTAFVITNYGSTALKTGDTIYLAVRFNQYQYDMYLTTPNGATPYVLKRNLNIGDTITINPGYLIGDIVLEIFSTDTLNMSLVVYGKGKASFNNSFPTDPRPSNNITLIRFIKQDLGIQYTNYSNNQITNQTTIQTQFKITNYGPNVLLAGDTLYLAARLNGQVYDLSLTKPKGSTPYILKKNLGIDSSLTIAPGNLNGPSTVAYLKTDTVQVSLLLYGVGKASVDSTFIADANPENDITSVTYNPTGEDLAINYLDYSNGQVLTFGNIQTAFVITNYGSTALKTGDTIYLAVRFNQLQYDMYLTTKNGATPYVLKRNLNIGDTITINPGYLIGDIVLSFFKTDTLNLSLVVYGKGKASFNNSFPTDPRPSNNIAVITFIKQDLGIQFTNYSNNQITNQTTIQTQFKITNYGPNVLLAGDTLYLAARLNGQVYDLSLTTPKGSTPYVLTNNLGVDSSITIAPGNLNGPSTVAYLKTDTVQVSLLLYGVGKASVDSTFSADANPKNNIASVTYKSTVTSLIAHNSSSGIEVYPNPAENEINFSFSGSNASVIVLSDIAGKVLKTVPVLSSVVTVNVTDLAGGIYIYTIYTQNNIVKKGRIAVR